ncbi:MAG: hypothetical protein LBT86_00085, partial [Deltaproteobacteria bacterium]|nr:hypothetical protein [Deltaproteobacteria bacterium]
MLKRPFSFISVLCLPIMVFLALTWSGQAEAKAIDADLNKGAWLGASVPMLTNQLHGDEGQTLQVAQG